MSSAEPFNFGRKIKDLKRLNKKGYSDLQAGLKLSRERIIALEENEREPTDTEKLRFANFYNLPPEEFGLFPGAANADRISSGPTIAPAPPVAAPAQRPYTAPNPNLSNPNYAAPIGNNSNYVNSPAPRSNSYGNERISSGNTRPAPGQNPNYRPNPARPPAGGFGSRPPTGPSGGARPASEPINRPPRDNAPRENKPAAAPKAKREKTEDNGEPKPVIKYTAEQLGDIESAYLRKQRDLKVPLRFTFLNGKEYTGVVTDFTPFTVHIIESGTGEEVILRKLAMAYYRKADALDEAQAEKAAAAPRANQSEEKPLLPVSSESEQV